jgi:TP901 family phage tail tape measure protein
MKGAAATIRMMLDTRQMSTGLQQINREMSSLSSSAAKFTGALGVGLSATAILADATRVVMDYSAANSRLAAILQTTKEATKELQEQQKELGASTKFTAAQVADAQTELAKLGFTQKEISASTSGVLSLAAAANIELSRAAEIAGGTLRGFGLRASESGRVVDVMAASFTKSALDAEKFAESMKYVAPVAAAAGIDVETTTALLGKLADSMISGSMGGTALKNLLSELSNENSDLAKEVGFGVKNSQDLIKAFEILSTKNIDLSKATQLTDERSKAAFLTLVNNTEALKELAESLGLATGAAEQLAKTMEDNLKGDLTKARSAWEGLILSLEDGQGVFSKVARGVVASATDIISAIAQINQYGVTGEFVTQIKKAEQDLYGSRRDRITAKILKGELEKEKAVKSLTAEIQRQEQAVMAQQKVAESSTIFSKKNAEDNAALFEMKERLKNLGFLLEDIKNIGSESINTVTESVKELTEEQKKAAQEAFKLKVELENAISGATKGLGNDPVKGTAGGFVQALVEGLDAGVFSEERLRNELIGSTQASAGLVESMEDVTQAFAEMVDPVQSENFAANLQAITEKNKALAIEMEKSQFIINNFGMELRNVLSQGMTDFENFGEALEGVLKRMIADLLAATVAAGALSFVLNAIGLGGGTSFKSIFGQISGMGALVGGVPKLASGGIVNRPTLAMIGEGGASEAVIPLNKLQGMMGGSGVGYINGRDIVFSNERAGVFLKRVGR